MSVLTGRERQFLVCVANGDQYKTIARRYGVTYQTVRNVSTGAKKKLGASTLSHAISRGLYLREFTHNADGEVI